jgi:hypothetical protein
MATLEELRAKKTQTAVQGPQQSALQKLRATQPAKVPAQTPFEKSGVVDVTKVQSDIQKVLKGVTLPQQDSVGTKTAKAVFGAPKKLFDTVTDKLSNTKYFREAAEGYNAMEQGKVKSSTLAYLAPELLGNVTEISKSFSGRGVANVVDTVVASPVNFATRAIYGKSNPVGDFMADFADEMRETFTTEESKKQSETEFSFKKISDPKFWMTTIPEQIPQTLAFVKIGSLAKGGATKLFGTSTFAKIASLATGGTAMRAFESSGEAEETYKTARAQGMSDKEAVNASKEVFMNNMALAGLDAVQLAIALAPIGKGTGSIMSKILKEVASAGAGAITEGGEEVYQYHIQQNALGNKKSIVDRLADPQAQEAGFIGALMGVAFQVGGRIDQSVSEKQQKAYMDNVASKLPPEVQTEYGTAKTIEEKQAVLDRVAEENAPAITSAVQQVETEHKKSVEAVKEIFNSQQEPTITPEVQASIDQVKQKVETTREIRQKDEVEKNLEENIKGLEEDLADTQIKLAEIEEKAVL